VFVGAVPVEGYEMLIPSSSLAEDRRKLHLNELPSLHDESIVEDSIPKFSKKDFKEAMPYFHLWYVRFPVFDGQSQQLQGSIL
jgi:hypothetical protein